MPWYSYAEPAKIGRPIAPRHLDDDVVNDDPLAIGDFLGAQGCDGVVVVTGVMPKERQAKGLVEERMDMILRSFEEGLAFVAPENPAAS